jgi:site-specific DNA-cytosine methylase
MEGNLWNWSALEEGAVVDDKKDEDEEEEEEEEEKEKSGFAKQAEGEKSQLSFEARLHVLRKATALTTETQVASRYKRRFWDSNDKKTEANDEEPVVYKVEGADIFGLAVVERPY